jgi:hypothetical protein
MKQIKRPVLVVLILCSTACSFDTHQLNKRLLPADLHSSSAPAENTLIEIDGFLNGSCLWQSERAFEAFKAETQKEVPDWAEYDRLLLLQNTVVFRSNVVDTASRFNHQFVRIKGNFISNSTELTILEKEGACSKPGIVATNIRIIGKRKR